MVKVKEFKRQPREFINEEEERELFKRMEIAMRQREMNLQQIDHRCGLI